VPNAERPTQPVHSPHSDNSDYYKALSFDQSAGQFVALLYATGYYYITWISCVAVSRPSGIRIRLKLWNLGGYDADLGGCRVFCANHWRSSGELGSLRKSFPRLGSGCTFSEHSPTQLRGFLINSYMLYAPSLIFWTTIDDVCDLPTPPSNDSTSFILILPLFSASSRLFLLWTDLLYQYSRLPTFIYVTTCSTHCARLARHQLVRVGQLMAPVALRELNEYHPLIFRKAIYTQWDMMGL